ncbi:MgtC/SapB family protein [Fodinibius halophilus]|uniref:MgtC/SapB family protein n=1 Tax=Fodinibius halophilus TaxID=1736908 RepID=A0A6M1T3I9_9BACT|nr:MgtC/SapB family protein [Fodinibius halophilus]NGP87785.1 MgtC/SapB family protein [Fodinibius halophilus]
MEQELTFIWDLLAALGIGLLIGIERGWSGRMEDEGDRVAGIRTFSLVGLLGGVWAKLSNILDAWTYALVFLGLTALIITSYITEVKVDKEKDLGITTEVALLLTFSLSTWAALGYHGYALGVTVVAVALLSLKPTLHKWLKIIEVKEIYAAVKLLVISVILLPLLPNKGYGPWDTINPYWIWWMVVLISGLSFIGYILIKYIGEDKGTILTAITGGLASSTAVTISLAQFARQQKKSAGQIFIAGILVASSIMFIRVGIEVAIVNKSILHPLWIPLTAMFLASIGGGLWLWRGHSSPEESQPDITLNNPLQLMTALQFGLLLGLILLLTSTMKEWYGDQGIYLLSFLSGLMDVDAITLSLSKMAQNGTPPTVAISGIIIAVISNTLVKAGLFTFWAGFQKSIKLIWFVTLVSVIGVLCLFLI